MRVCREPDCPTLIPTGTRNNKCPTHQRADEQARGSSTQRGYGHAHQATRAQWAPLVATGHVRCWRCRRHIDAGEPWDLGHDDVDRSRYRGPEHAACNRRTASR